jgi:hypothetical protein
MKTRKQNELHAISDQVFIYGKLLSFQVYHSSFSYSQGTNTIQGNTKVKK